MTTLPTALDTLHALSDSDHDDDIEQKSDWSEKGTEKNFSHPLPTQLSQEEGEEVETILRTHGIVSKINRQQVSHEDIRRLMPGNELNDEIINFYGAMILARSEASNKGFIQMNSSSSQKGLLDIHYFNSFFWIKLVKEGYEDGRLERWTRTVGLHTLFSWFKDDLFILVRSIFS